MSKPHSCGVLLSYKGKYLLVRSWGSDIWGIPKGGKEPDESEEEAATRELFEECNLFVKNLTHFLTYSTRRKKFTVFKAKASDSVFASTPHCHRLCDQTNPEIDAFAWVDKETAKVLTRGTHAVQIFNEL